MDFGIAKQTQSTGLTSNGFSAGTPDFMSPEQIQGFSQVGPAADQYSLGVTLYLALTGLLPFVEEGLVPLLIAHLTRPPRAPRDLRPELPEALDGVVLRMLAKRPEERFPSLVAVAEILADVAASRRTPPQ